MKAFGKPIGRKKKAYEFKPPKNKVIIHWLETSPAMKPLIEAFSGVKTEVAAKTIISKREIKNIQKAYWWDEKGIKFILHEKKKAANPSLIKSHV